jgi:hypothetical protein
VGAVYDRVGLSKLPSSAEEGTAERSEAGVVLFNKINLLINTTRAVFY